MRDSATLPALCRSLKTGFGKGKTALEASVWVHTSPRQSATKAGHKNIKLNPVFRGMVRSASRTDS